MITILQRVTSASVTVEAKVTGQITDGVVALIGFHKDDDKQDINKFIDRILAYRIFADANGKMNLSLQDKSFGLLLVPQFTIAGDTKKGLRPSFSTALAPDIAKDYFDYAVNYAKEQHTQVASGVFGANMQVSLVNSGPVTFVLEA